MSRWTGAKRYSGGSSRSLVSNCIRERVADSELFGVAGEAGAGKAHRMRF